MTEKTITITVEEWKRLQKDSYKLEALDAMGVDNWEAYDEAMGSYRETMRGIDLDKEAAEAGAT